jgi:Neuraminidase (sialidase)
MAIQKQDDTIFASEPETSSNNPQWHAPVLNVYNAEDAEYQLHGGHMDASSAYS